MNPAIASSQEEYEAFFGDQSSREAFGAGRLGAQALVARLVRTRKERSEVFIAVHEGRVRRDLSVQEGESWSCRFHADVRLLLMCGNFRSLRSFIVMTAAAPDESRSGNLPRKSALLHHIYAVPESAAQDPAREMQWSWPILGIQDPDGLALAPWAPAEQSAAVAYHNERTALEAARKSMEATSATAAETNAAVAANIKKEVQAELDRRKPKGGKGNFAQKGGEDGA